MSGRAGYANGYGYSDGSSNRYDTNNTTTTTTNNNNNGVAPNGYGPSSGGRERRPGGYGGFESEDHITQRPSPQSQSPERSRRERGGGGDRERLPPSQQQQQQQRQRQQSSSSRSRTREAESGAIYQSTSSREDRSREDAAAYMSRRWEEKGPERARNNESTMSPQAIEDVLRSIQREWNFMTSAECVPVHVALQLMDTSTLGKADREPDFLRTHDRIQRTLKSIVNQHHQGFNSSIGTYHKIQSSISSSQNRVRNLRNSLEDAKSGLLSTKPELKGLATSSQKYDDIIQLFSQIQEIQSLPEKLELHISDKRFLAAVHVLHDAFRLLRRSDLENIGALADIRAYFSNQETSLTDILIEELHDHLYLKSPYCSDRWKPPVSDSDNTGSVNPAVSVANGSTWERPIYSFLARLDASSPMVEDGSRNPEADTFYYIQLLIEALNKMGNLDVAVDRIEQRLPVELFAVVDKTNAEVDAHYPNLSRTLASHDVKAELPAQNIELHGHVLSEFLWALYAKFESIAEGHRVVHDVIAGIVERESISKSSKLVGGFKEMWKLYQSEIRSLMHDYLSTDGEAAFHARHAETEARRNLQFSYRDKNRKMFKLSEIDQTTEMKAEQDELDEILKSSVPGLVSKSRQKSALSENAQAAQGNSGTGHKILIEPSVFNMSLLLPPSLSFIQRLKDIVPSDSGIALSTLTSFLDDFLVNVFLPQLDETVTDLCTLSFIAADAFTEDPMWSKVSPRPVFKGTVKFMNIVRMFCKMLDSIPPDQAFTQLLISQILTYYDKCCGWYKALVTKVVPRVEGGVRLKAAAAFAESGDIHDTVSELWKQLGEKQQDLVDKEAEGLLKQTDAVPLEPQDIISDPKTVVALSLLCNSMQWLASNLAKLRVVDQPTMESSQNSQNAARSTPRRWTLITAMRPKRDSISQPVYLPLNYETATAFDRTIQSFRDLATTTLFTLHVDVRCRVIHMLTKTLAGPNPPSARLSEPTTPSPSAAPNWWHIIMNQPTSASSTVLELNNDLIAFDTGVASYLGPAERWFISSGLARFIDQVFVSCTRYIGAMNPNGALRLQLDVLVLQQNLKNIIVDPPAAKSAAERTEATPQEARTTQHLVDVALPRIAKFLDWFLEGADKALEYAKAEKEAFAAQGERALAAGNGEPFTYEELKVLIDLCFSETLRGPRGVESREEFMAAKKASADALLRLNEIMWDSR